MIALSVADAGPTTSPNPLPEGVAHVPSPRQNVVELLRGLQDRFEQVILITHIEGVRDGLDQVIEVTFDPNSGAATVRRGASAPVGVEAL